MSLPLGDPMLTPSGEHGTRQFTSDNALGPLRAGLSVLDYERRAGDRGRAGLLDIGDRFVVAGPQLGRNGAANVTALAS